MRVFYVLYFEDDFVRSCLEAIRLLANPTEKHRAHITVRGPYSRKIDIARINNRIRLDSVLIDDIGSFFQENQNTVFFSCNAPELELVWNKSDYAYNPHITVYDGGSREFALRVFEVLKRYRYHISARVGGLAPLISSNQKSFPISVLLDGSALAKILGKSINADDLFEFSEDQRLASIDKICGQLAAYSQSSESFPGVAANLPASQ